MANGALGCSISGAGPTVFAWCEQQHAERIRDAMVAAFRGARPRERCLDLDARSGRRADRRLTLIAQAPPCTTSAPATPTTLCSSAKPSRAASRRTAGCTSPRNSRTSRRGSSRPTSSCRRSPRRCSRRSPRAIRSPPSSPAICKEAFDFPAPLVGLPNAPAPLSVLELFHGPTSAFKDFGARFLAACLERIRRGQRAQADDPRRDLGRYGRRGRGGVPQQAVGRCRRAVSAGPRLAAAGAAARVLGRQRADLRGARHVRRLPAHGEGGVRRSGARRDASALVGQQHQHRPPAAADGLLTRRRACSCGARAAAAPTSSCRPATSATRWRASGRVTSACRSARSCSRRTPINRHGVPAHRRVGAARRASRRWRTRWTSAIRATWSGCARCTRSSRSCRARSARRASTTSRSAARSAATRTSSTGCGARTAQPPPRCSAGCWRAARAATG